MTENTLQETADLNKQQQSSSDPNSFVLKRDGMILMRDLLQIFQNKVSYDILHRYLQSFYEEGRTFEVEGEREPLVEKVRYNNSYGYTYALHENPKAFEMFQEHLKKRIRCFDLSLKRDGMLGVTDLASGPCSEYSGAVLRKWLRVYYMKEYTFELDGEQVPLVEKVKIPEGSGYTYALVLHEHPRALEVFKKGLSEEKIKPLLKRPNMLTAVELASGPCSEYAVGVLDRWVRFCCINGLTFELNGQKKPLVEKVRINGYSVYALHENPKALEVFKAHLANAYSKTHISSLLKRDGMLLIRDLLKIFQNKFSRPTLYKYLKACYDEKCTFELDGEQVPLVEKVRIKGYLCYALHENLNALDVFQEYLSKEMKGFDLPDKRDGMLLICDLLQILQNKVSHPTLYKYLKACYDEKRIFELDGEQVPLVEKIKASSGRTGYTYALHENPKALEVFQEYLSKEVKGFDLPDKRDGMLLIRDLLQILQNKVFHPTLYKYLKACYDEKCTFELDGEQVPLVEKVKDKGFLCYALHENPKALEVFQAYLASMYSKKRISSQKKAVPNSYSHEKE